MKKIIHNKYTETLLKNETFTQVAKYFIVGGSCTVFDFSMLYSFYHFLHINYLLASVMSFTISAVVNYFLCVSWVFSVRKIKKQQNELFFYIVLSSIGLGITSVLMWTFTDVLGLYFMLSKLISAFITFWCNFAARKYLLHTVKK